MQTTHAVVRHGSAVYPAVRRASRKVTAFVDFLREVFKARSAPRAERAETDVESGVELNHRAATP